MSDNDFSLEDLQDIANALEKWVPDHLGLRLKISQMIDNYCQHDFKHSYREIEHEYCTKCGIQTI